MSYCVSDLVDVGDLVIQSYQITIITLSVISEIIYWWSYDIFRVYSSCQIWVPVTSYLWYHCVSSYISSILFQMSDTQLSDISCQLSNYPLLLTSAVVGDISYYYILNHIDCLLIKNIITRGTGVIAWWCMLCILEGFLLWYRVVGSNHGEPR